MFFQVSSHQLYGSADFRFEIRMAGISHLHDHPELYIESISDDTWKTYIKQISTLGNSMYGDIIIPSANALDCVILFL